ncbi:MAG: cysteine--tRNA ligase [Chloroflexota bacterium]|nr:MAG: cysteine--tRNA ligase [Chloroflexota bacterium]
MRITNTLTGQKEDFAPRGDVVRMYVCGVTPYDESHIGHAMSYVIFDTIRRYLEYRDYRVNYVQNFTDVDDKIIARANKLGVSATELADRFIAEYYRDMDALNIRRADVYPRVTEEIPGIIEVVEGLVQRGHAYLVHGDVYFRVASDPDYGKLSHRSLESLLAGARVEVGELKENPMDFALWKSAKPGEPAWDSPWGPGRPGWHIECSAMCIRHLGESIDIHGGGQDLIFPHHENEVAQSESYTGVVPFARYWLHNGLLRLGEEKMSKSLGNLVTIKEVLAKHTADALRLFILSSHYRSPLTYTAEGLEAMQRGSDRLGQAARAASPESAEKLNAEEYRRRFITAMDDDFNTPQAMGTLFDLARDINRAREEGVSVQEAQSTLRELAGVLGLTLAEAEAEEITAAPFIDLLIQIRAELRASKQWSLSDKIRMQLQELGIVLEDKPQGTTWKKA